MIKYHTINYTESAVHVPLEILSLIDSQKDKSTQVELKATNKHKK